jgi:hypothetical protein
MRFRQMIKKQLPSFEVPIQFFNDPEVAKTWLICD